MSAILYKDNPYGGTTTVTDAGHILVNQGSDTVTAQAKFNTQTTAIQRILGNFATVESSTTASKAYNVGDYLVLNSFLYKVTAAIAAGGTIDNTENGNVVKTNAGAEFGSIGDADNINYDNTESGLTATNVQDAVDELDELTSNYVLKNDILGIRTCTQHVNGRLRYVDIALPTIYANKDQNNYFVSVMPLSETDSVYSYFVSKSTGSFRVYVRDTNNGTAAVWMDVLINIRNNKSNGLTVS